MLSDTIFEMTQQLKLALSLHSGKYDGALLNELQEMTGRLDDIRRELQAAELDR